MDIDWKNEATSQTVIKRSKGVLYFTFKPLNEEPWLINAFSTRLGGVSTGGLASMNLGFGVNDEERNVRENFRRFSAAVGFSEDDLVYSHQTHTVNVLRVYSTDRGKGLTRQKTWKNVDGFVTDDSGVMLSTYYADCVPLYFADPVRHAIGLSHSGWRGTANGMGRVTVEKMKTEFGSCPEDLICVIGPSICRDCYEVSEDVAEKFDSRYLIKKENGKYKLEIGRAHV